MSSPVGLSSSLSVGELVVGECQIEVGPILLREAEEAGIQMIAADVPLQLLFGALVLRAVVIGGDGRIVAGAPVVIRPVEVIEKRAREHRVVREGVRPGQHREIVRLTLHIAELPDAARVLGEHSHGAVRYLVIILPQLGDEGHRILLARLVLQVRERTVPVRLVVDHLGDGGLQAEIAAIALDARIVREVARVARDADVVVGLAEIPRR